MEYTQKFVKFGSFLFMVSGWRRRRWTKWRLKSFSLIGYKMKTLESFHLDPFYIQTTDLFVYFDHDVDDDLMMMIVMMLPVCWSYFAVHTQTNVQTHRLCKTEVSLYGYLGNLSRFTGFSAILGQIHFFSWLLSSPHLCCSFVYQYSL